jgi:ABC-type nitrate/sulfonate/bicarbonate transport system substrate-binding protein
MRIFPRLWRRFRFLFPRPLWERARVRGMQEKEAPPPQSSPIKGEEVKRRFGLGLMLLAISLMVAWPREIYSAENSLIVLSYPDRPAKLPLWLAQDAGLFEKYGLKVDIRAAKSGEDVIERLKRDEAQIYAATASWIVSGIGDGKDLVFFANTGYSVLKFVARPDITRAQDLQGKRIGTREPNSSQDRITRQVLQRLGLNPDKDVTLIPFGSRSIQRLNALLEGEIDATTSNEDNLFELERRGEIRKIRVLADNESLKLFIGAGVDFAVTREFLRNSRFAVKGFVKALSEAIGLARRNRAAADQIYARYLNVKDPGLLEFMYRTYVQGAIPERPYPKLENVSLGIEEFGAKPALRGKRAEDLIDLSLLRELEKERFFDRPADNRAMHGNRAE